MNNAERMAALVIGSTGGAAIKQTFRIDTIKYAWVPDYLKDKKIREQIEVLRRDITEAQNSLIHKEELRPVFESRIKALNKFRSDQLREVLSAIQSRQPFPNLNESVIGGGRTILGAPFLPFFIQMPESDIDEIFSQLPEGVRQSDIEKKIETCRKEISKLEGVIASELSPQSRWVFNDRGDPLPYPNGCRWTEFVTTWSKVVARFEGSVDIEGCLLTTPEAFQAYHSLDMGNIPKITPLRPAFGK